MYTKLETKTNVSISNNTIVGDKKDNKFKIICKRSMGKIIFNPIIIACICAPLYIEFLVLYIVGALLALFFEQRLNIFKFAAANHECKKNKIILEIKEDKINNNQNTNNNNKLPEYEYNNIFETSIRNKLHEMDRKEKNTWTYTHNTSTSKDIMNRQNKQQFLQVYHLM